MMTTEPLQLNVITRRDAQAAGLKHYFTGQPCKRGHVDRRFTSVNSCLSCNREKAAEFKAKNPEKVAAWDARWQRQNPAAVKAKNSRWARDNRGTCNAAIARYRAQKLNAMPSWVDQNQIDEVYKAAIRLSAGSRTRYHVDHIIPLQGRTVCGLHVPWNLQPLPAIDNIRKGNRITV